MDRRELLVSLISDQTMPNVQIIKELNKVTDYLFISTESMEKKNVCSWIEDVCSIEKRQKLIVNQFSLDDIKIKLSDIDFSVYNKIHVNLTGGTKLMTIAVNDFFNANCHDNIVFYYVTGKANEYISYSTDGNICSKVFKQNISLSDYLMSYGFEYERGAASEYSLDVATNIFNFYCDSNKLKDYEDTIKYLNEQRNNLRGRKNGVLSYEKHDNIAKFIEMINFEPHKAGELDYKEVKYLSGEWFEEYIGLSIKKELQLSDDELYIGATITKQVNDYYKEVNNNYSLIGNRAVKKQEDPKNEIDVMFMYKGNFYSIECKSIIFAYKAAKNKKGENKTKKYNILGETIYKVDSIKSRFGLYSKSSIVTLTDFKNSIDSEEDNNKRHNMVKDFESLIKRANLSGIKLVDGSMLLSSESIGSLFIR